MKKTLTFLTIVMLGSSLMLVYVSQQVKQLQCSYRMQAKQKRIIKLADNHKNLSYQLDLLKSPAALEEKLLANELDLIHPTSVRVVFDPLPVSNHMFVENTESQKASILDLDFIPEAHADASFQR